MADDNIYVDLKVDNLEIKKLIEDINKMEVGVRKVASASRLMAEQQKANIRAVTAEYKRAEAERDAIAKRELNREKAFLDSSNRAKQAAINSERDAENKLARDIYAARIAAENKFQREKSRLRAENRRKNKLNNIDVEDRQNRNSHNERMRQQRELQAAIRTSQLTQKNLSAETKNTSSAYSSLGREVSLTTKILRAYYSLQAASVVGQFARNVFEAQSRLQSLQLTLQQLVGVQPAANQLYNEFLQLIERSPFTLDDSLNSLQQLIGSFKGVGASAEQMNAEIIPILESLGNSAAALGGGDRMGRLVYAFSQVQSAGRLMGTELRQIAETGLPLLSILSQKAGVSTEEMMSRIRKGKVSFEEFKTAILEAGDSTEYFAGVMDIQVQTVDGRLSNLGDLFFRLKANIGDALQDSAKNVISFATDTLNFLFGTEESVRRTLSIVKEAIVIYGAFTIALQRALFLEKARNGQLSVMAVKMLNLIGMSSAKTAATVALTNAETALAVATANLNRVKAAEVVVTAELTAAQAAQVVAYQNLAVAQAAVTAEANAMSAAFKKNLVLLAVTAAIYAAYKGWTLYNEAQEAVNEQDDVWIANNNEKIVGLRTEKAAVIAAIDSLKGLNEESDLYKIKLSQILETYPSYFRGLDANSTKITDLTDRFNALNSSIEANIALMISQSKKSFLTKRFEKDAEEIFKLSESFDFLNDVDLSNFKQVEEAISKAERDNQYSLIPNSDILLNPMKLDKLKKKIEDISKYEANLTKVNEEIASKSREANYRKQQSDRDIAYRSYAADLKRIRLARAEDIKKAENDLKLISEINKKYDQQVAQSLNKFMGNVAPASGVVTPDGMSEDEADKIGRAAYKAAEKTSEKLATIQAKYLRERNKIQIEYDDLLAEYSKDNVEDRLKLKSELYKKEYELQVSRLEEERDISIAKGTGKVAAEEAYNAKLLVIDKEFKDKITDAERRSTLNKIRQQKADEAVKIAEELAEKLAKVNEDRIELDAHIALQERLLLLSTEEEREAEILKFEKEQLRIREEAAKQRVQIAIKESEIIMAIAVADGRELTDEEKRRLDTLKLIREQFNNELLEITVENNKLRLDESKKHNKDEAKGQKDASRAIIADYTERQRKILFISETINDGIADSIDNLSNLLSSLGSDSAKAYLPFIKQLKESSNVVNELIKDISKLNRAVNRSETLGNSDTEGVGSVGSSELGDSIGKIDPKKLGNYAKISAAISTTIDLASSLSSSIINSTIAKSNELIEDSLRNLEIEFKESMDKISKDFEAINSQIVESSNERSLAESDIMDDEIAKLIDNKDKVSEIYEKYNDEVSVINELYADEMASTNEEVRKKAIEEVTKLTKEAKSERNKQLVDAYNFQQASKDLEAEYLDDITEIRRENEDLSKRELQELIDDRYEQYQRDLENLEDKETEIERIMSESAIKQADIQRQLDAELLAAENDKLSKEKELTKKAETEKYELQKKQIDSQYRLDLANFKIQKALAIAQIAIQGALLTAKLAAVSLGLATGVGIAIAAGLVAAAVAIKPPPKPEYPAPPSFFVGTDDTSKVAPVKRVDSKGGFNAILHPKEAVFNAEEMLEMQRANGGKRPTRSEVVDAYKNYQLTMKVPVRDNYASKKDKDIVSLESQLKLLNINMNKMDRTISKMENTNVSINMDAAGFSTYQSRRGESIKKLSRKYSR